MISPAFRPRISTLLRSVPCLLACASLAFPTQALTAKSRAPASTSAYSEVSRSYERVKLPNGRFRPETYAFGEGKCFDPEGNDASMTSLSFHEIVTILAGGLYEADYVPTPSPEETELLILVSWGKTLPADDGLGSIALSNMTQAFNGLNEASQMAAENAGLGQSLSREYESQLELALMMQDMADQDRRRANAFNAQLLGYHHSLKRADELKNFAVHLRFTYDDLLYELESPRYFVILQAYDFRKLMHEREKNLLWTTRFSIRAKGRKFGDELQSMTQAASRYFGAHSRKIRRHLKPARVEFGELEYLGIESK